MEVSYRTIEHRFRLLAIAVSVLLTRGGAVALAGELPPPVLGLTVQPGGLLIREVVPGETYDLKAKSGVGLTVSNQDGRPHTYVLSTHRPSEIGNRRVPVGYSDIVDPSWFWFEKGEITVPPQSSSEVKMYLRVPAEAQYRNQHWSVSVGVVGKPGQSEVLTLAAFPRFEIETASATRAELRRRPAGAMPVCPSKVVLPEVVPGTRRNSSFILSNSDTRRHRYEIIALSNGEDSPGCHIFGTGGYAWLPEARWVRVGSRVQLGKWGYTTIPFRITLPPDTAPPAGGWELILLVKRDDGVSNFVRVFLDPAKSAPPGGAR